MRTGKRPAGTKGSGQVGKCQPHAAANPVGDDACTAPAGAFRRPKTVRPGSWAGDRPGNPASPQGPREGHGPPLQTGGDAWLTGKPRPCVITNLCRGRFHIGPVCGGTGPRGRDESRPYDRRRVRGRPGKCQPHAAATPVGDDACIVPGTLRRRKVRGRAMALPYKPRQTSRPDGMTVAPHDCNLCRGRCSHRPGNLVAAKTLRAG